MPGLEDNSNTTFDRENHAVEQNSQHEIGQQQEHLVRETTQTDHLNQKLLKSLLERMKHSSLFQQEPLGTHNPNENSSFDDDSL